MLKQALFAKSRFLYVSFFLLTFAFLSSCGGGGSSTSSSPAASQTVSGVAAAGAPIVGTVTLKDSAGHQQKTTTNSDGTFSIDASGLTSPFFLLAEGTVGATNYQLYSLATGYGTANINPLTIWQSHR